MMTFRGLLLRVVKFMRKVHKGRKADKSSGSEERIGGPLHKSNQLRMKWSVGDALKVGIGDTPGVDRSWVRC